MNISLKQQNLTLDASGAIYWANQKTLLIADAHLGKVNHFRKNGIAVPHQSQYNFYKKMHLLFDKFRVNRIYFLGDLFHSEKNKSWQDFEAWVRLQKCELTLISGNHDIIPINEFTRLKIKVEATLKEGPFLFTHFPTTTANFNFCGHLHPGVQLRGKGLQRLKVPCFFQRPKQMILPAFGVFTGIHILHPKASDKVYALSDQNVIPIPIK